MSKITQASAHRLDPARLPLAGRHLIEASAGTGKTYNITRLYLRLLLEKQLSVQQILVMTFTKAATEELRSRIDKELRNALLNWGASGHNDPFFAVMEQQYSKEEAERILKPALLELDEAAIYTIHAFCNRALTTQAFASGMTLELSMEADTSELLLEAVRDWIRLIACNETDFALLSEKGWHVPEEFLTKFKSALYGVNKVLAPEVEQLQNRYEQQIGNGFGELFNHRKTQVLMSLQAVQIDVFSALINGKKDQDKRQGEWLELVSWLETRDETPCPKAAADFVNGNRYRGNEGLKKLFEPFKSLREDHKKELADWQQRLNEQIENVPVYQLVVQGINRIRQIFLKSKQQLALMDFNDLITCLSQRLQSPDGQQLVNALRRQYPVALVDEFQDTDPEQYAILDTLYPRGDAQQALMMIGDPKQAIYAFRGGDIFTYLSARDGADYQWYMDTNWRSVAGVVTGYNRLFWGKPLSEDNPADIFSYGIGYERINSTDKAAAAQQPLSDPDTTASSINYLWLPEVSETTGRQGDATTRDWQQGLALWCVGEISRLLTEATLGDVSLREQDIAILVRRGSEAQLMREALEQLGFPSVYLSDKENIYDSEEARELLLVLTGLLECEDDRLLVAALSTCLMGGDAAQLAAYTDGRHELDWEIQRNRAVELRQLWQERGCMAMLLQLIRHSYCPEPAQHERALTNMIHLAELLQQASRQFKQPQQLLKWFRDQCQNNSDQEEAQLRLESDANLIRIVTQHGSKGLEYPVVFIPFASYYKDPVRFGTTLNDYFEYHDPHSNKAIHQIGQSDEAIELATREGLAESIRLLYVAVTRASHRCYLGIAPFKDSHKSPLGLALQLYSAKAWEQRLTELVNTAAGSSVLKILGCDSKQHFRQPLEENSIALQAASFQQSIDDRWSLSSFSGLVRNAGHVRQDQKERDDEAGYDTATVTTEMQALRFTLRKGADTGNLLHDILEHTDFSQKNIDWPIETPVRRFAGLSDMEQNELTLWLQDCLEAALPPIAPLTRAFKLTELSWDNTLRETEFYFPVSGVKMQALAVCLQQHRGNTDPIFLPGSEQLLGMMHGFIDLIFEYKGRFYVADYKSTHLGEQLSDYHRQALLNNNQQHFYDLQYLIYSVALHRYLSVRLENYDPKQHFGGVYYLYLRGMSSENDHFSGVFQTEIETSFLLKLDQVFQGEALGENAA